MGPDVVLMAVKFPVTWFVTVSNRMPVAADTPKLGPPINARADSETDPVSEVRRMVPVWPAKTARPITRLPELLRVTSAVPKTPLSPGKLALWGMEPMVNAGALFRNLIAPDLLPPDANVLVM